MLLLKLGGSVITNKAFECTFVDKRTRRLVEEIRYIDEPMVMTHGAGSFGHKKAEKYRLREGFLDIPDLDQLLGFSEVQKDVRDLNTRVLAMMTYSEIKGVSVPTCSSVSFSNLKLSKMEFTMYDKILKMGNIPVGFGDVVFDTKKMFAICSADDLMVQLAKKYRPTRAVFVTDVDGLFEEDPHENVHAPLVQEVKGPKDIPKSLKPKTGKGKDVTGGIVKKVEAAMEIARNGVEAWFVNGCVDDRVSKILNGIDVVGTRFVAKGPRQKGKRGKGGRKR